MHNLKIGLIASATKLRLPIAASERICVQFDAGTFTIDPVLVACPALGMSKHGANI